MSFIVQLVQTNSTTEIITCFTQNVIKTILLNCRYLRPILIHIREEKSSMHVTGPHSMCTSNVVTLALLVVQEWNQYMHKVALWHSFYCNFVQNMIVYMCLLLFVLMHSGNHGSKAFFDLSSGSCLLNTLLPPCYVCHVTRAPCW